MVLDSFHDICIMKQIMQIVFNFRLQMERVLFRQPWTAVTSLNVLCKRTVQVLYIIKKFAVCSVYVV